MQRFVAATLLFLFLPAFFYTGQVVQPQTAPPQPAKPALIIKPVPPDLADAYEKAATETARRQKALEETAPYQAFLAAQNEQGKVYFYIVSKIGAQPECKPQFDKQGKLTGFECDAPAEKGKP